MLYSQWGAAAGTTCASDGGFEEWTVKIYPILNNPTVATIIVPAGPLTIGAAAHDTAHITRGNRDRRRDDRL